MLALSIQQPWAWLITHGYKDVENRTWPTKIRGRFYIHAGKKLDHKGYQWIKETYPEIPLPNKKDLYLGGVVGEATLDACVTEMDSKWFFGDFGYVLKNATTRPFAPYKGRLGFFNIPSLHC